MKKAFRPETKFLEAVAAFYFAGAKSEIEASSDDKRIYSFYIMKCFEWRKVGESDINRCTTAVKESMDRSVGSLVLIAAGSAF